MDGLKPQIITIEHFFDLEELTNKLSASLLYVIMHGGL